MAALSTIVGRNLAVVHRPHAAVCGAGTLRGGPGTRILCALPVAGGPIAGGAIEIARRVVARLRVAVPQSGRDVSVSGGQTSLPAAHRGLLVRPGIFAVPGRLGAILGCDPAVVDSADAAVGSLGATGVGQGAFIGLAPAIARRGVARGPIAITGRIVARLGLSITQPGGDVAVPRRETSLPPPNGGHLVNSRILAVLRRLGAIVRRHLAVEDRPLAAVGRISPPRIGARAFVCRKPSIACRAIAGDSIELSRSVVAGLGVTISLLGREVAGPGGES